MAPARTRAVAAVAAVVIASVAAAVAAAAVAAGGGGGGMPDGDVLGGVFAVDAVYHADEGLVRVVFEDAGPDPAARTTSVVMEVQGLEETFQRRYERPRFVQDVPLDLPPRFGWQVHPVTFVVDHPVLGMVAIKTEIRAPGDPRPAVIYGRP